MSAKPEPKPIPIPVDPGTQDVPVRLALALCHSEDIREGLEFLNVSAETAYLAHSQVSNWQYYGSQALTTIAAIGLVVISFGTSWNSGNLVVLVIALAIALIVAILPQLAWQVYQYGFDRPKEPVALGHEGRTMIDTFFARLQSETGPRVYFYTRILRRRVYLDRAVFLGRLRYWLLSGHASRRQRVTRFPISLSIPVDIYLESTDVRSLVALSKPKREGGPGRNPKYAYAEAIIDLIGNTELLTLDLSNEVEAQRKVQTMLVEWFQARADLSGDAPRTDMVAPYAKKIVYRLRELQHAAKKSL